MIICVLQRTNNAKICFTRTTHGKIITMIRVSCLSCPRRISNCQHYRNKISAAAGHWQTNPSRVRLIELSLSSYSFIRYPLFTYLSYWMDQCEWSSCVVRSLYKMASQKLNSGSTRLSARYRMTVSTHVIATRKMPDTKIWRHVFLNAVMKRRIPLYIFVIFVISLLIIKVLQRH